MAVFAAETAQTACMQTFMMLTATAELNVTVVTADITNLKTETDAFIIKENKVKSYGIQSI